MKLLHLDALRDIAIAYIPALANYYQYNRNLDQVNMHLAIVAINTMAKANASAPERQAACLLSLVMPFYNSPKLAKNERRDFEVGAINAAHELLHITGQAIPTWLTATAEKLQEIDESPEKPPIVAPITSPLAPLRPGMNLTTEEAAKHLNVKPGTLRTWASKQNGPAGLAPIKNGRRNVYLSDEVIALMQAGFRSKKK